MTLQEMLEGGDAFQGYAYAYPHKTAYRQLTPVPLREAWANEEKDALFLYAHIPFCEMRCGFCNLFTTTHPGSGLVAEYLSALERQAEAVSGALGSDARFARVAIGGGTPTFLEPSELERMFRILHGEFAIAADAPVAIELSPQTTLSDRLAVLRQWGVTRVSLGVQSFIETETRALGRAQRPVDARLALERLRNAGFPVLNVDLIYGVEGQTLASWRESLEAALEFAPEEIYLYPLYVRPLTGLGVHGKSPGDARLALYREGRDLLLSRGYRQISMRLFRSSKHTAQGGPEYCCQDDGMVGIGAGARSYTAALHYSSEWAVGRTGVRAIIEDYIARSTEDFTFADYGCELASGEQQRRYIIKSLLRADGLDALAYTDRFGTTPDDDLPELSQLSALGGAAWHGNVLRLTSQGMEWSDVIGPWLFSPSMIARMEAFVLA